jgi:hypothetical protein
MSSADLTAKRQRERDEWRRRGVAGVVRAVDPASGGITLDVKGVGGSQSVIVSAGSGPAAFRRYAPGSTRFADARPSSIAEIQPGDQLRALGERSTDGTRFVAEQIVTGAFRSVTATIDRFDREKGLLTVSETATRERLSVAIGADTTLKRLTPEVAARLTRRRVEAPGESAQVDGGEGPQRSPREERAGQSGAGRRRAMGGGPTLADMLDQLPTLATSELKNGDAIVFSCASVAQATSLKAIVLVAGLETLAPQTAQMPQRGRNGGVTLGLAAEALDLGMDLP